MSSSSQFTLSITFDGIKDLAAFQAAASACVSVTQKQAECLEYLFSYSSDGQSALLIEVYKDWTAFQAHMADVAPALVPKLFSFAERIVMRISCDAAVLDAAKTMLEPLGAIFYTFPGSEHPNISKQQPQQKQHPHMQRQQRPQGQP